jgi:type IX secretion system PorP/SprF family membrane protein
MKNTMYRSILKKLFWGVIVACSSSAAAFAQQDMMYTQYLFNYLAINPAYAGYNEATTLQAFSRVQWVGVNGAPNIYSLSVDGTAAAGDVVGWGGQLVNERRGPNSLVSLFGSYAFRIRVNQRDDRLSFGLSAGVTQWQLNRSELRTPEDINFASYYTRPEWRPEFRVGVYYNTPFFYAGASATNIFSNFSGDIRIPHLYVSAGGFIPLNNNIGLKPSFIYRTDFKGPGNLDVNLLALLMKQLWVGVSYRTGIYIGQIKAREVETIQTTNALAFMLELFVIKNMQIGYSYDLSIMGIGWPGAHEISLSYTIPKKRTRQLTPRYF